VPRRTAGSGQQNGKKRGHDGLVDRERAFVRERRKDPAAPNWLIAHRAGYLGDTDTRDGQTKLAGVARRLLRKDRVMAAVFAPASPQELAEQNPDDATIKKKVRTRWLRVVDSPGAANSDAINAGDKLMKTIVGGYVPTEVDMRAKLSLESLLTEAGLSPEQKSAGMLPGHDNEPDAEDQNAQGA
jgi:hypothetical protein